MKLKEKKNQNSKWKVNGKVKNGKYPNGIGK